MDRAGLFRLALKARRLRLWRGNGLTVLLYHRVVGPQAIHDLDPGLVDATPDEFDQHMAYVREHFNPISVEDLLAASRERRLLPPDSALVTFDDGYLDNYEHALPILLRHRIKALFFITTGYLTNRRLFWWERTSLHVRQSTRTAIRLEYPAVEELDLSTPAARDAAVNRMNRIIKDCFDLDLDRFLDGVAQACGVNWTADDDRAHGDRALMTWDHVRALRAAGMGIGSHTRSHRILHTLPPAVLADELVDSRAVLEQQLGEPITTIAYPAGKSIARVASVRAAIAAAGYELGFTTTPGTNRLAPDEDPFDLRRLCIDRGIPTGLTHLRMAFPSMAR
jgi:peptidoglycan/xylan/chitin deacetylase (PgdA/CDA1 family)